MYLTDETIAAIASAPGGAARGIVRLSGPAVGTILETCFRAADSGFRANRAATVLTGAIALANSHSDLPAEVYFWPNQQSYTRQPIAEIHTIGSPPLLSAVLRAVCTTGARVAEPGEFTLRAFLAGRLDLTQAEAVLGVIDARGQQQLTAALAQLAGGLTRPLTALRELLVELLAQLEAGLDFVEEDIEFISAPQILSMLEEATRSIADLRSQLSGRAHSDEAVRVVLVGWPNVGKSSLFNALARGGQALVSDAPGTTRDYLTAVLTLEEVRCQLVDTAGIEPEAPAEHIGGLAQRLGGAQAAASQIRLLCLDPHRPLNDWERAQLTANHLGRQLVLLTKCDVPCHVSRPAGAIETGAIETSARTGSGLDELKDALRAAVCQAQASELRSELTAERCSESVRLCGESLERALALQQTGQGHELIACEVRVALTELGKMVGTIYTDDILDRIFSRFCIGK